MAKVRNITQGPKGVYAAGVLVMVEAGKTAEADDYNDEWFKPAGESSDEIAADLEGLDLNALGALMVKEGIASSVAEIRSQLARAIALKRDGEAGDDEEGSDGEEPTDAEIVAAIAELDAYNDDHWTQTGLPQVDAVAGVLEYSKLRRADIDAAAPNARRPEIGE